MATITGQIYNPFAPIVDPTIPSDDIVPDKQSVSTGLWSAGAGTLSTMFLDSVQSASSGVYYLNVLNAVSSSVSAEIQFAIAYGHRLGSGSYKGNEQFPSRAIYSQYRNVLLDPSDTYFTIGGVNKDHIIVINVERARVKEKIDPGNWQINISGSILGGVAIHSFIDDSGQTVSPTTGKSGRVFNIISGSIAAGSASGTAVGLAYPDMGLLIFDPDILSSSYGVVCNDSHSISGSSQAFVGNAQVFFNALSSSASNNNGFIARNEEQISSTHYFVRVKNREFNFSNNPTFISGTYGDFWNQDMIKNPTVYITTVGLYNDNNELLAVAKLSQPLKKTFNRETIVRVKLDY